MFNIWVNKYGLNVVLLGHQFQFARPDTKCVTAQKLQKDGPLSVCLATLYAHQGWLKEMRERVCHSWKEEYGVITRVPMPHRHGGNGRNTLAVEQDALDHAFLKDAIGFEFGGDVEKDASGSSKIEVEKVANRITVRDGTMTYTFTEEDLLAGTDHLPEDLRVEVVAELVKKLQALLRKVP